MLTFINASRPANDCFPASEFQVITLNGRTIGEMYRHHRDYHAIIKLTEETSSLMQGHGSTRTAAVMEALGKFRAQLREFSDALAVLTVEINDCIVMEPEPTPTAPVTSDEPAF